MIPAHLLALGDWIGWGILVAMGLAIVFGGPTAIGVVSGISTVIILGYAGYVLRRRR